MGTLAEDCFLRFLRTTTHINKKWQTAMLHIKADTLYESLRPVSFDANLADCLLIAFLRPVPLTIRTGTDSMMANAALAQCLSQVIKQYRFARMRRATNDNGR